MPYLWQIPETYPDEWIGRYDAAASPDRFLLRQGQRWPAGLGAPVVKFSVSPRELKSFDVLPNNAGDPLVSNTVVEGLQRLCDSDFEVVPTHVIAEKATVDGYSFINVVAQVNAIDLEQSSFVFIPGTKHIMKFKKLRLKDAGLGGHHLVRDMFYPSYLFVSNDTKELFDYKQWRGVDFGLPEAIGP
jgi:hypothetical protein